MSDTSVGNGGGKMHAHTPGGWYYNVLAGVRCSPKEGNHRGALQLQELDTRKSLG
jgi:hypothetical protein